MNRSITNTNIFNLTPAELNSISTFDQLMAEYKNIQVPSNNVFKEDGWKYGRKYKFDKVGNNKTTGVGIRKCKVLYPTLQKTKDAMIIEKGQFVDGKLDGDNCIKAIKDLHGNTTIYMGQFVDGEPKGRIIQIDQPNNSNVKQITIGNMSENMKFAGQVQQYLYNDYSKISGGIMKQPQTFHRDNEQLWILHNEDKKQKTLPFKYLGYNHKNSINILNAKKNRTSIQMLEKIPLAKNTKHLKILLDNSQQNILNTKIIAESIKAKMDKINKKNKGNKQSLSSIYISYTGNKYCDNIIKAMRMLVIDNTSKYCFFSKIKDEYQAKLVPSCKYGIKRMVIGQDNEPIELADMTRTPDKYKEYYCIYKDPNGDIQVLSVPHDLARNRVTLIEAGKLDEALTTLQKGESYSFEMNGLVYELQPYDLEKKVKYGEIKPLAENTQDINNNQPDITQMDYYDTGIISGTPKSI